MREHIQGAVQFVSNNHLKFDGPSEAIAALPDPGQTFGYVNKPVPQPTCTTASSTTVTTISLTVRPTSSLVPPMW